MTIATEISKLQENLANAYSTIEEKGATLPSAQNFDNLATTISSIPSATSYTAGTGIDITNGVISVTSGISTGAALGATAVQPADLASVATSGSYNDLSNKPNLDAKANIDLLNLTNTGKNIANWSTNVTNCITEIRQDIKLELNNGVLTLKAGSKVYVPNGAGVFDTLNIASDIALTQGWRTVEKCVLCVYGGNALAIISSNRCASGSSDSISGNDHWYYNTTDNTIRFINSDGTARTAKLSMPIAIITMAGNNANVSRIDQVCNGFGYIGSTVFALPGVKGLIPNGRNADGSLKNIEFTTKKVLTLTGSGSKKGVGIYLKSNELQFYGRPYKTFKSLSDVSTNFSGIGFIIDDNLLYTFDSGVSKNHQAYCVGGVYDWTDDKISSFIPKTVFHASDFNDVALKQDLARVATSGSYNDLSNKPDLSTKANIDLSNCTKPHIVETYVNGTSWYRVYSDGWCEQGANNQTSDTNGGYTVTFLKPFKNTNYNVTGMTVDIAGGVQCVKYTRKSAASISFWTTNNTQYSSMQFNWQACGYIS